MSLAMCEVPVHPVEFLSQSDIDSLPELPMTQDEDGTWYCDGESTQETTSGKNLLDVPHDFEFESVYILKDVLFQAGMYYMSYENVEYGGDDVPCISFFNNDGNKRNVYLSNKTTSFTLPVDCSAIYIYSNGYSYSNSVGITAKIKNLMISKENITIYEPYTGGIPSPNPDYPQPIINTYPAGTYKAICGDKTYKVVLDDDLRSVPGVADRVRIDAGRGVMLDERYVNVVEFDGSEPWIRHFSGYFQINNVVLAKPKVLYIAILPYGKLISKTTQLHG